MAAGAYYHALIRTHHITSRRKIATLKDAAKRLDCHAILRSGGVPGVMFVEGTERVDVQRWVDVVHGLRYKAYHLASPVVRAPLDSKMSAPGGILREVESLKEMAGFMEAKGLLGWWRSSMGFSHS